MAKGFTVKAKSPISQQQEQSISFKNNIITISNH